jgi:signal transduction histidine kinase
VIKVYSCLEDNDIVVKISDTGVGIPQEKLPHIFEPFFTTKPVGEGTGLGLSIVYSIIESHHGTIKVDSKLNEGTTFTIRIPVKRPSK